MEDGKLVVQGSGFVVETPPFLPREEIEKKKKKKSLSCSYPVDSIMYIHLLTEQWMCIFRSLFRGLGSAWMHLLVPLIQSSTQVSLIYSKFRVPTENKT